MKNTKKILLGLGATAAVATPIVATVSCSLFGKSGSKSSYQFWNYEDYMGDDQISQVKSIFGYSEFGDLPEFRQALIDETAAGGIGSDYFNAKLAEDGLISKIDFSRLYGITTDKSEWGQILETYYTPEAWTLLNSFELKGIGESIKAKAGKDLSKTESDYFDGYDDDLTQLPENDVDGDGTADYLWEYMAPYFIQNKVVAVNTTRLDGEKLAKAINDYNHANAGHELKVTEYDDKGETVKDADGKDQTTSDASKISKANAWTISAADFQTLISKKWSDNSDVVLTYANILSQLKLLGLNKFTVNDYMRDNMMIGSEKEDGTGFTGSLGTGSIEEQVNVGKQQIASFKSKLSGLTLNWQTSGVKTLSSLIQSSQDWQAALMYNGDALYAYNGGVEEEKNPTGQIRVIVPENPTFLLDGFVISSSISNNQVELDRMYNIGRNTLYQGANTKYEKGKLSDAKYSAAAALAAKVTAKPGDSASDKDKEDYQKSVDAVQNALPRGFAALAEENGTFATDARVVYAAYSSNNSIYSNFDYVGYTAAFGELYKYLDDNYFDGDDDKYIFDTTHAGAAKLDGNHITQPLDDKVTQQVQNAYEASK